MKRRLELAILPQPNCTTCGPTCLHALYRYYGDAADLGDLIDEIPQLEGGGTFSVLLGAHALRRGYQADLYTYNLQVFDPTWFTFDPAANPGFMLERMDARRAAKPHPRLRAAIDAYAGYIRQGGRVHFEDLTGRLIRSFLEKGTPIIAGLSSTYLYRAMREHGPLLDDDDVIGDPQGHFVVLCGYDREERTVLVADPLHPNPAFEGMQYVVSIDRVLCAILLGILTHDADLLIIRPIEDREQGTGNREAL